MTDNLTSATDIFKKAVNAYLNDAIGMTQGLIDKDDLIETALSCARLYAPDQGLTTDEWSKVADDLSRNEQRRIIWEMAKVHLEGAGRVIV